jgi:diguanylate cyclase (GGDEF)-like protein
LKGGRSLLLTVHKERDIVIALLMTIGVFAADLLTPLWYDAWVLYLVPMFFMFRSLKRPYIYSVVVTVLIVADLFLFPSDSTSFLHAEINRFTGILGGWGVSVLLMQLKRMNISLLQAGNELEMRVEDRTSELAQANRSLRKENEERIQAEEERKRIEDKLQRMSITDELTGLLNRRGFYTLGEQQLKLSNRNARGIYLLYTDLNDLKKINDTFGHGEGDAALRSAAMILKECFRNSDVVARIGGDEFAVIPIGMSGDNLEVIIERFLNKIESYNKTAGHEYKVSMSVGTAYYDPLNPVTVDELLTCADKMMYEDKKKNKQSSSFF